MLQVNYNTGKSYCGYIQCSIPNCRLCLSFNQCELCQNGYNVSTQGYCVSSSSVYTNCPQNCLSCNSSSYCTRCIYGYNEQNGECEPNNGALIPNCQAAFTGFTCQLCAQNYMVAPSYQCTMIPSITCNVDNCYYCETNNQCSQCQSGYQLMDNGQCENMDCDTSFCTACSSTNSSQCEECQEGYELNDNFECVPKYLGCSIQNCLVCMDTWESCAVCEPGYTPVSYGNQGSACQLLTSSTPISFNVS